MLKNTIDDDSVKVNNVYHILNLNHCRMASNFRYQCLVLDTLVGMKFSYQKRDDNQSINTSHLTLLNSTALHFWL